ncbi:AAA family ATPase [uncultured Jatrophihabitans sp.]|uniref:AAA family ATPase n=1 Tax=uncultured Jatrophihabitans sp. TaxID=1610747 RepID=UPI0035CA4C51
MGVLLVTGGGDVDGPLAVGALAAVQAGPVALVQLVQTGLADGRAGELARASRLVPQADAIELARYDTDLLPVHAAAESGRPAFAFADAVRRLLDLDTTHERVLARGAGGLLAPYDDERRTLVDLAHAVTAPVVVIGTADRDGLDRLLLTASVLEDQALTLAGVVLTSWPDEPTAAHRWTLAELWRLSTREVLAGVVPAGARDWPPAEFRRRARTLIARGLGGTLDARAFVARHAAG